MTSLEMPNYIHRYCKNLDDLGWMIFYSKMVVPFEIIKEVDDLIYLLKWILKADSDDFTYSVYIHDMMGAEGRDYIQEDYLDILHERYHEQFLSDFASEDHCDSGLEDNSNNVDYEIDIITIKEVPSTKELVCKFGKESWTVIVCPLKINTKDNFYELMITDSDSQFHLIIGTHSSGLFLCIPSLGISCELDSFYNSFCNHVNIHKLLPVRDAETIIHVLTSFIPFAHLYETHNFESSFPF